MPQIVGRPTIEQSTAPEATMDGSEAPRRFTLGGLPLEPVYGPADANSERIGAPVATTLRGKDLFSGMAGNIGIFGTLADLILMGSLVRGLRPRRAQDCRRTHGGQGRCAPLTRWSEDGPSLTAVARDGTGEA